jgi:hypothetical protein
LIPWSQNGRGRMAKMMAMKRVKTPKTGFRIPCYPSG